MSVAAAPSIGLARLPSAVRELLHEAATNVEAAAVALHALGEHTGPPTPFVAEIIDREREGDRITHDLRRELTQRLVLGPERDDLLRLIEAVDDVLDAIDEAASPLSPTEALPPELADVVTAILRDLVRTGARSLVRIDAGPDALTPLHERAAQLRNELRQTSRHARAALVSDASDPLSALRGELALDRLDVVGATGARLLTVVHQLTLNHAE